MGYSYSSLDKKNIRWFGSDNQWQTLAGMSLVKGSLRGLNPFSLTFEYPITAIAGENGSGKSTILAMAACGFHNKKNGFKLPGRKNTYYTFSDFFVQSPSEITPEGIEIDYNIRHNKWYREEPGLRIYTHAKKKGGRWSDYDSRIDRQVIYFGIQRVVPHFERSAAKSYRNRFRKNKIYTQHYTKVCAIAGTILGKTYDSVELLTHSKYSLPQICIGNVVYTGFNMGAGECAIFEILFAIFAAGEGALFVIDELELGLHEQAQRRFVHELKKLCDQFHCQIICSTHSHAILDALPPEGRFFIQHQEDRTEFIPKISSDWACGKLAGRNSGELQIFVEDDVAKTIVEIILPLEFRTRVTVKHIGSSIAVLKQLSSKYQEQQERCLAILDGDKRNEHLSNVGKVVNGTEPPSNTAKKERAAWVKERLAYLPGDTWPERWLLLQAMHVRSKAELVEKWRAGSVEEVKNMLESALREEPHKEFYKLGILTGLETKQLLTDIARFVYFEAKEKFSPALCTIKERLHDC